MTINASAQLGKYVTGFTGHLADLSVTFRCQGERVSEGSVCVAVMCIRVMRMAVGLRIVAVLMGMRPNHRGFVHMIVVVDWSASPVAMGMRVGVLQRFMTVFVGVVLSQMQPNTQRHQTCSHQQGPGYWLGKKHN